MFLARAGLPVKLGPRWVGTRWLATTKLLMNDAPTFRYKTRRRKSEEQLAAEAEQKRVEEAKKSGSKFKLWGAIASTHDFNKKLTKWYIAMYVAFLLYGYYYFGKMYNAEQERKDLLDKRDSGAPLSEYERLRIRELSGDRIRTIDKAKLEAYHKLKEEYNAKLKKCQTEEEREALGPFDPQPADIDEIVDLTAEKSVLPARDLSSFYDTLAPDYDKEIGSEEFWTGMSRKRQWLMSHCRGDVLEVASGTGRNTKYIQPKKISSYTFLDPSEKMMAVAYDKFQEDWPNFKKVKFVVGRAEDLIKMSEESKEPVKYDTIIETFGLCSEEDPVQSLKNMKDLLKVGGRIVLLEHGRGSYDLINNRLDKEAQRHSDKWGCRWNLDIGELLDSAGLEVTVEKRSHLGTTWSIVAKRPGDVIEYEELGFIDKYLGTKKTKNLDSSLGPNNAFGAAKEDSKEPN